MKVLVDTSVWSLALRRSRRQAAAAVAELAELIGEGRVSLLGAVRQELLSGIRSEAQFVQLRDHLRSFPDLVTTRDDHEAAAKCFNRCRARGIQGSNTDFLLCAVSVRHHAAIFTTDEDFAHFGRVLRIVLHQPRSA